MYLKYFGLNEAPFSITPDPRFVFLSARHEDALAHLKYGIAQGGSGGFIQLTGEVGTGKTTLSRLLLEDLPDDTEAALILNPLLEPVQLLEAICEELGVNQRAAWGNSKKLSDRLNDYLLKAHADGKIVVVLIDEAQNLSPAALEQVRLLTNLETPTRKLLQIILLGQPELRDVLRRADLRQLAQRITARYHLMPLDAGETAAYVEHRLKVAGAERNPFTAAGLSMLHKQSSGIPRLINIMAERSLLAAYAGQHRQIGAGLVRRAAHEVRGEDTERRRTGRWGWAAALVVALAAIGTAGWQLRDRFLPPPPTSASESVHSVTNGPAVAPVAHEPEPVAPPLPTVDRIAAWRILHDQRRVGPMVDTDCRWQIEGALHCLEGRGRMQDLERLGRPVAVSVAGGYGVVAADGSNSVRWWTGGEAIILAREQFESRWSGLYWDVWEMPGYVPELVQEGDRGPAVLWIKAAARRATPAYAGDVDDPYFGPALTHWVSRFQQHMGMASDGLLGPKTLQYLSRHAERTNRLPGA